MFSILEKKGERRNILNILKSTRKAIKTEDVILLKDLSNNIIHSASIYQDTDSITIAVTVYALSKIIERKKYTTYRDYSAFISRVAKEIDKAIEALEKNNIQGSKNHLHNIRHSIAKLSGHLKIYIKDVFRKAQINKASRVYEHGISRAETAAALDITQWELAEYVGATGIADVNLSVTKPIKERINFTFQLFE